MDYTTNTTITTWLNVVENNFESLPLKLTTFETDYDPSINSNNKIRSKNYSYMALHASYSPNYNGR